jgi:hypothetical protein
MAMSKMLMSKEPLTSQATAYWLMRNIPDYLSEWIVSLGLIEAHKCFHAQIPKPDEEHVPRWLEDRIERARYIVKYPNGEEESET